MIDFPETISEFTRGEVNQYDASADDISVGYNESVAPFAVAATIYVYPGRQLGSPDAERARDKQEFEGIKTAISQNNPGGVLVSDDETVNISNPRDHTGKRAVFEFQQGFGSRQLPARSEMYLFGLDKWFVEYRFTYPKEAESSSTARIRDFMASLRWPD